VAIELPDDLISAQQAADDAHTALLGLQQQYGHPDGTDDKVPAREWSDEQRAAWDTQQAEWRRLAELAQAAVTQHAKDAKLPRHQVEAALRKAVRHPQSGEA